MIFQKDSLSNVLEKERQLNSNQVKELETKISKINSDMVLIQKELAQSKKELLQSKIELAESKEELAEKEEELLLYPMENILQGDTIRSLREELSRLTSYIWLVEYRQNIKPATIIGEPYRIGNLEVAQIDFPHKMDWPEAVKACADLGEGWRLPNKEELNFIYQNRNIIGFLTNIPDYRESYYWSSTESANYAAWCQSFYDGKSMDIGYFGDYANFNVRAVRSFK